MKILLLSISLLSLVGFNSCSPTTTTVSDATNPVAKDKNYPVAFQYENSTSQVISPYKPHNVIDVSKIKAGHLARDTSTAKIDKATGKPIISTAKIFRVPSLTSSPASSN